MPTRDGLRITFETARSELNPASEAALKQFADRQLSVDPKVLDFIALHIDRSLAAAALAVDAVDRAALASGRKITRQLAAGVLGTGDPDEGG